MNNFDVLGMEMTCDDMLNTGKLVIEVKGELKRIYPEASKQNIEEMIASYLEFERLYKQCERTEHKWMDESYGNPETGCIAATCKRCGYSFHHTLY